MFFDAFFSADYWFTFNESLMLLLSLRSMIPDPIELGESLSLSSSSHNNAWHNWTFSVNLLPGPRLVRQESQDAYHCS